MEDAELLRQAWLWLLSRARALARARGAFGRASDRHWPAVRDGAKGLGRLSLLLVLHWRNCTVRGFGSLVSLGSAAPLLVMWCCFLSLTSTSCLVYALLVLGAAGAAIRYLGYTPGLFIVGLLVIFMVTSYAVYCVKAHAGWLGVVLSINLSFLSNDLLNRFLEGYDGMSEAKPFEEPKESEPFAEEFSEDCSSPPSGEAENSSSCKSFCKTSSISNLVNVQKGPCESKVVKDDSSSLDEMNRIMGSKDHYEALGFLRHNNIDVTVLKKEYKRKVLSDSVKKRNYDEQLRKEESRIICQNSNSTSQQDGLGYRSEESRKIECTKCGKSHIWICTKRPKAKARWCQDCSQYHQARDGDGWVEIGCSLGFSASEKVDIPRAFVCAESKIFDVSEWAICQGMECKPNTHRPTFHVNMVSLEKNSQRSSASSRFPWDLDAQMMEESEEDDFELWLQQALAAGYFSSDTTKQQQRRKSWSPFKLTQKISSKHFRRSP
ncbi:hypothetical protein QJS04_geneDACA023749 [Acorus gramineus]|uniref:Cleavage inducing molecular chaperone Jiv domain-containing protein n=1 Tax=Acorus gramineus TaxID=55184 RepID=A0AAV9BPJ5_ACOGR|nr:hypothetical protein QJS04_geneDACA023749 [Acorus gramineus]